MEPDSTSARIALPDVQADRTGVLGVDLQPYGRGPFRAGDVLDEVKCVGADALPAEVLEQVQLADGHRSVGDPEGDVARRLTVQCDEGIPDAVTYLCPDGFGGLVLVEELPDDIL